MRLAPGVVDAVTHVLSLVSCSLQSWSEDAIPAPATATMSATIINKTIVLLNWSASDVNVFILF
jgi:hypothetical protein